MAPRPTARGSTRVVRNSDAQRYELLDGDELIGTARYYGREGLIVVTRLEIRAELRNQGFGAELAKGVLDQVRAEALKVEPRCSYLADYIEEHSEDADLVDAA